MIPAWLRTYRRSWLSQDLLAGSIVAVMLVPQSLGYAMLAGLPPHVGMYASIVPLLAYALLGTSMTLAVGPVAISSLMTAAAVGPLAASGLGDPLALSAMLALLSGLILMAAGLLRLGFLANLLSHSVVAGFVTGSALLIAIGQLDPLLGIAAKGETALEQFAALVRGARQLIDPMSTATALIGIGSLILLWLARSHLAPLLSRLGMPVRQADLSSRAAPMVIVLLGVALVAGFGLDDSAGVAVVGPVPTGLPSLKVDLPNRAQVQALLVPALMIALVNFVESISVARSLAARRKERIDADAELRGLGAANLGSAVSGGFPVAGGFARSSVNFAAGAQTPLAGVISAVLMALVLAGFAQWFERLPLAILAATIIAAVLGLVDFSALRQAWDYDRGDALAFLVTGLGVLLLGVEAGILFGVVSSLGTLVWRTSRPHIAVIGRVPGTEHFRNVDRHRVQTLEGVLAMRIDENLLFTNARAVQDRILGEIDDRTDVHDVLLVMSSVSQVDLTGLEMLIDLSETLQARGQRLSLAEVKGPVQDRLQRSELAHRLTSGIHLSAHQAFVALARSRRGPTL